MPEPQADWKSFVLKKVWVLFLPYSSLTTHYKPCISTAARTSVHAVQVQACRCSNTISQFTESFHLSHGGTDSKNLPFQHEGKVLCAGGTGSGVQKDVLSCL